MEVNGLQHTDLKPCNILISKKLEVTVIDFNIISQQLYNRWSNAYGTWSYVAPEILLHSEPCATSVVWSFGVIIAYLFAKYPLDLSNKKDITTRKFWRSTFQDLMQQESKSFPLSPRHKQVMSSPLVKLYEKCTQYCATSRPTLQEVYYQLFAEHYYPLSPKDIITEVNIHNRCTLINEIFAICKISKTLYAFTKAIMLYDKCAKLCTRDTCDDVALACYFLSLMLLGVNCLGDKFMRNICSTYWQTIDVEKIENHIYMIGDHLGWDLWFMLPDIWLAQTNLGHGNTLDLIKRVLQDRSEPYTSLSIFKEIVAKEVKQDEGIVVATDEENLIYGAHV
jgi:serine/threonine protein kinase